MHRKRKKSTNCSNSRWKAAKQRTRERERERERVVRRRRRRRWEKKAYHRWRRHADHNKLQGWWCKKQEEEKRNIFGKPFQQQPYHVLLSLMFCCISLLSQSSLSLSLTSACPCVNQILPFRLSHTKSHNFSTAKCIWRIASLSRTRPGTWLDLPSLPFLPSLEPRRISDAQRTSQWFQSLLSWKNLNTLLNVVLYLYKCKVYSSL